MITNINLSNFDIDCIVTITEIRTATSFKSKSVADKLVLQIENTANQGTLKLRAGGTYENVLKQAAESVNWTVSYM